MMFVENKKTFLLNITGVVQGVGMRYFVYQSAKNYGVTGYVKNKRDGSVECLVQGKEGTLNRFIEHIKSQSPGDVNHITKDVIEDSERYPGFEITF